MRGKPKTIGTADMKRIRYTIRMMLLEWQTDYFIWTASCEAAQSNKLGNKKIHGWFRSQFLLYIRRTNILHRPSKG